MRFYVELADECGECFVEYYDTTTSDDAWDTALMDFPESEVLGVYASRPSMGVPYDGADDLYDDREDYRSPYEKSMGDRLDAGRNEAAEWLGFM